MADVTRASGSARHPSSPGHRSGTGFLPDRDRLPGRQGILAALLVMLTLLCAGCASKDMVQAPSREDIEAHRDALAARTKAHTFTESASPFLQGRLVSLARDSREAAVLRTPVTLQQTGTLAEIAASLSRIAPVSALVAGESAPADPAEPVPLPAQEAPPALSDILPDSLPLTGLSPLPSGWLDISYSGTLAGLLDTIASMSGYGWDFDEKLNRITFSAMQVRTFSVAAAVGEVAWDSQISNKSREQRTTNIGSGSTINTTVTSGDTSTQTAQTNTTKVLLDVWQDVEKTVRGLLSRTGTVSCNPAAGTITVRDSFARLKAVEDYITTLNERLSRQVALCVRVWVLEASDAASLGLNLQALFSSPDVAVAAGSAATTSSSLASVSILKGSLEGSSAAFRALKEQGNATQLTSASGLVMHNQPFPVQAIRRHAYLAGMTMSTSEYSQTSEITPGEVTTGFAMTIVPHILPDRHVLLQYNITLSSLDELTTLERDTILVQLPQVSTRSCSQRTRLKAGQTLVLAGFEQDTAQASRSFGLLSAGKEHDAGKTLLVITIELEGADNV